MKKALLLVAGLFVLKSYAQIDVFFESRSDHALLIGVDQFAQNPEPVTQAVITGLDTGLHQISIVALGPDTLRYEREIRLLEKEKQHYVLQKDFTGEVRLQYRGIIERFPLEAIKIEQQRLLAWERFKNRTLKPKEPQTNRVVKVPAPPEEVIPDALIKKREARKDSLNERALARASEKKEALMYTEAIAAIKQQTFEFEKLQVALRFVNEHNITLVRVKELARLLRFDDSRLQLALQAKKKLAVAEKKELADIFQFEYSRNAYLKSLR